MLATRFEKTGRNYLALIHVACACLWLVSLDAYLELDLDVSSNFEPQPQPERINLNQINQVGRSSHSAFNDSLEQRHAARILFLRDGAWPYPGT